MPRSLRSMLVLLLVAAFGLSACTNNTQPTISVAATAGPAQNAIQISIIYAPESEIYLKDAMASFNQAYAEGRNPVTGQPLAQDEKPIYITGKSGSSGTVMQGIVNAFIAPNNQNVERPTIFSPSVSHWLVLANYQVGRDVFDLANSPATALAPVVMAIWESRLKAIQKKHPNEEIGWQQLLEVINNPNGWEDYGFTGRRTVYYGHTDPFISSTALSTLMAEFYASARYNANFTGRRLTMTEVNDQKVQDGVRQIENLIKHYSQRTTEFKEYIAKGPEYVDFVALEENDLIYINQGKTQYKPPERLVALYPKEGTFWHEHPFAIPNGDWVSADQRAAAKTFTDYVLSVPIQQAALANGFRPANPNVALGYPIVSDLGVDPDQPKTVLDVPDPQVVASIQQSWSFVKKQADIWMVVDISGSMRTDDKIGQARKAALAFLDKVESQNRVGLIAFNQDVNVVVPLDTVERNEARLKEAIEGLTADGGTALYDATAQTIDMIRAEPDNNRIRALVILSDGQDTESKISTARDVINKINATHEDPNPVIVIPIAYGADADVSTLGSIARAATTSVQSGDVSNITQVLQIISSYF
ncbi:MAG: VWA domain-containing protein [Anaerolineae bacterium]|nr:VWA domain-containing protein [Anaerolineae bacterium]